jgi:abortive infection bacteriophage resistance protein
MTAFDKPAQSIDQHLDTLRQRGLAIHDEARARHYLGNISYYRLSAYTRPFYQPEHSEHAFLQNTCFDDVLHLYLFDRELRLLLLDAIERQEVALRAQLSNTLAEHHGPHGYLDATLFDTRYDHGWLIKKLGNDETKAREVESFLAHYRSKYTDAPSQPPIWMAVELLTFKEVSTLFANLRQPGDTQRIETHFGWKFPLLKSWFRSLSDLRNICAHHARVWNREFGSRPEMPRKIPANWPRIPESITTGAHQHPTQTLNPRRRLYLQVVVIESLMQVICLESRWAQRLVRLLDRYPEVSRPHMGFPAHWDQECFWLPAVHGARQEPVR